MVEHFHGKEGVAGSSPALGSARRLAALLLAVSSVALAGCSDLEQDTSITVETQHERGADVAASSGCLGCHRIGDQGNTGPGPDLSGVGSRMSRAEISRALVDPTAPMPSYARLRQNQPRDYEELVDFLAALK